MSRWLAATRRVLQAVRAIRARIHGTDYWKSTGFHDLERARRAARELENRIREGDLGWDTICPTVAEWWAQYRTAYSPKKRAPHRDPQLVAPFLARFGTARLDTFKKFDCERWVGERSKHVSARTRRVLAGDTVRREHGFLKGFFQKAVEDGLLKSNPWKGVRAPGHVPQTRVLSYEEEAMLRAALRPDYLRLLTVILGTGMREGELLGLRPTDVTATMSGSRGSSARRRTFPSVAIPP